MGPTVMGLAMIPALPILFDEPVEHVIDTAFDWAEGQYFKGAQPSSSDVVDRILRSTVSVSIIRSSYKL